MLDNVMVGKATPLRILGSWQPGKPGKPGCLFGSLVAWNFFARRSKHFRMARCGLGRGESFDGLTKHRCGVKHSDHTDLVDSHVLGFGSVLGALMPRRWNDQLTR